MAITWGTAQTGGTGGFRLGYETFRSGNTLTVSFYVNTKYAVDDVNNTFVAVVGGTTIYNGAVSIKTYSSSSWSDSNTVYLATGTSTSAGTISFSASLTSIDTVGASKKATVSGSAVNYVNGTEPTINISQTAGSNVVTFYGYLGTAGDNNALQSSTIYYKLSEYGSWYTISAGSSSGAYYSQNMTLTYGPGASVQYYIACTFAHNTTYAYGSAKWCNYYTVGGTPTCRISQAAGVNKVTISGNRGENGWNNEKTACYLYYNLGLGKPNVEVNLGKSGSDYTYTIDLTKENNGNAISAYVTTSYPYMGNPTGYATSYTPRFYSHITGAPVYITDNKNNTFTLSLGDAKDGYNNKAGTPTELKYGYTSTTLDKTYKDGGTYTLAIDGTKASRTVYAQAITPAGAKAVNSDWYDIKVTESLAINQYLEPTPPSSAPVLSNSSYKNGRLTLKQNWTYTWGSSTKQGCAEVSGYAIAVRRNGDRIRGLTVNNNNILKLGTGTRDYVDTTNTTCSVTFDPNDLNFKKGDTVWIEVWGYSLNGKDGKEYSADVESKYKSIESTVESAGILQIKPTSSSGWKEGQVWVKVNKGTIAKPNIQWVEADTVKTKVRTGGTDANPIYSWVDSI